MEKLRFRFELFFKILPEKQAFYLDCVTRFLTMDLNYCFDVFLSVEHARYFL